MFKGTVVLLAAGLALGACDAGSRRDLTSPSLSSDAALLGEPGRSIVRADGSVFTGPRATSSAFRLTAPALAAATTTTCDQGVLEPDEEDPTIVRPVGGLSGGTYDNIEVPAGAICVLDGVTVTNSVRALAGSMLFVFSSSVGTDILGVAAQVVQLNSETTVAGNLDVRNAGGGIFASCAVDNSTILGNASCIANNPGSPIIRAEAGPVIIGGSVSVENNVIPPGNVLLVQNADIGINANVNKNTGGGFKGVTGNTVGSKLECKKNDLTFVGGPNTAGTAKGQCF